MESNKILTHLNSSSDRSSPSLMLPRQLAPHANGAEHTLQMRNMVINWRKKGPSAHKGPPNS